MGPARAVELTVDYGITLAGLSIGAADLKGSFEGDRYRMQVQARLGGLAGAITGGKGGGTSNGSVSGARPVPAAFAVTSRSSSAQITVRMGLANGNAVAVDIQPPLEEKADRVPLSEVHKRGVIDPVSALLMPSVGRGELIDPANCNRTIPVFDGATRFNVILTYAETKTVEKGAFRGPVLVCNARYAPIAGHRQHRPGTKFMEDNRDMSVWLAPVVGTRLLVPWRIAVQTMIGMSVIEATRWTSDGTNVTPTSLRSGAKTQ